MQRAEEGRPDEYDAPPDPGARGDGEEEEDEEEKEEENDGDESRVNGLAHGLNGLTITA